MVIVDHTTGLRKDSYYTIKIAIPFSMVEARLWFVGDLDDDFIWSSFKNSLDIC